MAGHGKNSENNSSQHKFIIFLIKKTWKDYNLKWDPIMYGNITTIRLPASFIWIPGIYFCYF
jgi:hypothetical protein